jgi:hypothetical protein
MQLKNRAIALYGRFSAGLRERLQHQILQAGGHVARDLTQASDLLVVGGLAFTLIESGALGRRLHAARQQGVPILGERAMAAALAGEAQASPTLPLATALGQSGLDRDDADLLAAFDLVAIEGDLTRFGDVSAMRTAAELRRQGRTQTDIIRILTMARDAAPMGRHRIVVTGHGQAALQWQDGLTTLDGQGFLPLDDSGETLEDLFEAAAIAEATGHLTEAARLYDQCSRADRADPIAPYNYANICLEQEAFDEAALAYQRALARDAKFIEARYNLAKALEAIGKHEAAAAELTRLLKARPKYADALFNLAQLRMKADAVGEAKSLYERFLALNPPEEWAATARKGIGYCTARMMLS